MNSHYWRSCPMLVRCKECSQVVEVATLSEHLLMECEQKEHYSQCSQCTEGMRLDRFEEHVKICTGMCTNIPGVSKPRGTDLLCESLLKTKSKRYGLLKIVIVE